MIPLYHSAKNQIRNVIGRNKQRLESMIDVSSDTLPGSPRNEHDNNVLVISQSERTCGVYQYGRNITNTLEKSEKYNFVFCECSRSSDYRRCVSYYHPLAIIYNYYPATMAWLTPRVTRHYPQIPHLGIIHEFTQKDADATTTELFDYSLYQDPNLIERNPYAIKTLQLLYPYINTKKRPDIPTIGSFGFAFPDKGFVRIVETVQREFDEANIRFHLPFHDFADRDGKRYSYNTVQQCLKVINKPDITLNVTHEFKTEPQLLDFLAGNTINAFFYDAVDKPGISGAVHHALAVHRPVAITKCGLFKHLFNLTPTICIEDSSLKEIIGNGLAPLQPLYDAWSEPEFIRNYEQIITKVIS